MKNLKTTLLKIGAVLCGALLLYSCSKDEGTKPEGKNPAIELDCDYFKQDRVLTNDPEAPVDYIISCEANVTADLKIEPGVVIAFTENASLSFEEKSSFKIEGTADKPIVFTGTVKEKGVWRGVLVESNKASNTMKYVTIEYAGSKSTSHRGEMAPAGLQVAMDGDVKIEHCTFQHCKDNGLFWTSSKYISITNSQFTKNDVPMMSHGVSDIKLYNNTNDYTGNTNDYVHLQYSGIENDNKKITWNKINVPYYITTRNFNRFEVDKAELVIEPGVDIIFATAETRMRIRNDASISAVGTENDPIIFRGSNDIPAAWSFIYIFSGSALNEIGHAKVQNAGHKMSEIQAAVQLNDNSYLNLHDVSFTKNAGYAVGMHGRPSTWPVLVYADLTTDNNKMFCKGENGADLTDPNDPDS